MAIYVTGDTHQDFSRFTAHAFPESTGLTKKDYMIICGDFGGVWSGEDKEQERLDQLDALPFTTLFVDGNHENYDLLSSYKAASWNGGNVQFIRPSVIHLMRGQCYTLEDRKFFTMGGAASHDVQDGILDPDDPGFVDKYYDLRARNAMFRIAHLTWWAQEMPDIDDYQAAWATLQANDWAVDYIITHCAPTSIAFEIGGTGEVNDLTDFLQDVEETCSFKYWFFGHYHQSKPIDDKFIMLYHQIMRLT